MDNCYVILESMYIKYPIGDEFKLKHVETDHLFGMVAYENEEAAIDMAKDLQTNGTEVADEKILKQLPDVDVLGDSLKYYSISQLENTVITYKVMDINILKSKPVIK